MKIMSTASSAAANTPPGQADSTIGSGRASVTRLLDKSSSPKSETPAAGSNSAMPQSGVTRPLPSTGIAATKSGDRTSHGRASALPTFAGSRRASNKTNANANANANASGPRFKLAPNSIAQKRLLENQLTTKKQRYTALRRELAEKEKHARELYDEVAELRDKAMAAGLKDPEEMSATSDRPPRHTEGSGRAVTGEFVGALEGKLSEMTNCYQEVCHEALGARTEIIGWLADFSRDNESEFGLEIIGRLKNYELEGAGLRARLEEAAAKHRATITELMRRASALWGEHENYRTRIRELETRESSGAGLAEELAVERERALQLKERRSAAEAQLQKARTRIRELEGQTNGAEARIQQLQATVRSLEVQLRQRETALEARNKEMHRALKSSEDLVARTEKQRDSLESRVAELKRKIDSKEAELDKAIENLAKRLGDAENRLATEKELRCQAEERAEELGERCAKLEAKSKQLCDLAESTKGLAVKSADGKYTDSELQLWNELQSTRTTLAAQNEKLLQVRREKEQMRSVLQRAADQNDPASVRDKLAAEVVMKTEELQKAAAESAQLQLDLKMARDKGKGFERQLSELRDKLRARSKEGGESGWGAHAIELQQQLCDLRTTLADLTGYNEKLELALTQKQLELEQRDRVMQEQSKVLRVRDELIELLNKRGPNANGDPDGAEIVAVGRQVQSDPEAIDRLIAAKSEDLETLYRALEGKQMQLTRLETVVRQMEDENERSQATRTKLERELARLRLQLNEKSRDQRYVGQTIFSEVLQQLGTSEFHRNADAPYAVPNSNFTGTLLSTDE